MYYMLRTDHFYPKVNFFFICQIHKAMPILCFNIFKLITAFNVKPEKNICSNFTITLLQVNTFVINYSDWLSKFFLISNLFPGRNSEIISSTIQATFPVCRSSSLFHSWLNMHCAGSSEEENAMYEYFWFDSPSVAHDTCCFTISGHQWKWNSCACCITTVTAAFVSFT
jgi:hypothetical protein